MSDLDLFGVLAPAIPQGPDAAADTALTKLGAVYAVDAPNRLVRVAIHDTLMWLPAQPARYRPRALATAANPALARVLMDPNTGRPALVLGALDPREPRIVAALTAIDTVAKRATVTVDGASHVLPYLPSTYTVGVPVWVDLDDWGVPYLVSAPSDIPVPPPPAVSTEPPAPGAATIQVTQYIGPQWSSTYRHASGKWGDWNRGRYGGTSTLYQGNGFGSGLLTGLATYGDQLVNLGATSIDAIEVALIPVGLSGASGPATVQGSPQGEPPGGAPVGAGDTASGDGLVALPASIREGMRTGSVRGLALVGGNYWAVAGAGNGDGMVLVVTYTRPA